MDQRGCWSMHTARGLWIGKTPAQEWRKPLGRFCFLVLPVWNDGLLGRPDCDEQRLRDEASFVCVAERWVYLVGSQAAALGLPGVRSYWSALVPRTSCLRSLQGFIFLSVRTGTPWFEHDPFDGGDAAPASRARECIAIKGGSKGTRPTSLSLPSNPRRRPI